VTDSPVSSFDTDISSDGKRIVFVSPRTFENGKLSYDIYSANIDGSDVQRLTNTADEAYPVFSPDDETIAFTSYRDGGNAEIYTMNADGSEETRLTNNAVTDDNPDYSPDGSRILFRSRRNETGSGPFQSDLFTMKADGSDVTEAFAPTPGTYEVRGVYAPDGESIAFLSAPNSADDLVFDAFTAPVGGSTRANVTNTPDINELHIDWQRLPGDVAKTCSVAYPNVRGGSSSDEMFDTGRLDDAISAGKGNDGLSAKSGSDCLLGQGGDDELAGGRGDDELFGGPGRDVLRAGGGVNTISCGRGRDVVRLPAGSRNRVAEDCEQVIEGGA
jgi:Ca2+-binding RTX toxin-like protein